MKTNLFLKCVSVLTVVMFLSTSVAWSAPQALARVDNRDAAGALAAKDVSQRYSPEKAKEILEEQGELNNIFESVYNTLKEDLETKSIDEINKTLTEKITAKFAEFNKPKIDKGEKIKYELVPGGVKVAVSEKDGKRSIGYLSIPFRKLVKKTGKPDTYLYYTYIVRDKKAPLTAEDTAALERLPFRLDKSLPDRNLIAEVRDIPQTPEFAQWVGGKEVIINADQKIPAPFKNNRSGRASAALISLPVVALLALTTAGCLHRPSGPEVPVAPLEAPITLPATTTIELPPGVATPTTPIATPTAPITMESVPIYTLADTITAKIRQEYPQEAAGFNVISWSGHFAGLSNGIVVIPVNFINNQPYPIATKKALFIYNKNTGTLSKVEGLTVAGDYYSPIKVSQDGNRVFIKVEKQLWGYRAPREDVGYVVIDIPGNRIWKQGTEQVAFNADGDVTVLTPPVATPTAPVIPLTGAISRDSLQNDLINSPLLDRSIFPAETRSLERWVQNDFYETRSGKIVFHATYSFNNYSNSEIFVYDRATGTVARIEGLNGAMPMGIYRISDDGRTAFVTTGYSSHIWPDGYALIDLANNKLIEQAGKPVYHFDSETGKLDKNLSFHDGRVIEMLRSQNPLARYEILDQSRSFRFRQGTPSGGGTSYIFMNIKVDGAVKQYLYSLTSGGYYVPYDGIGQLTIDIDADMFGIAPDFSGQIPFAFVGNYPSNAWYGGYGEEQIHLSRTVDGVPQQFTLRMIDGKLTASGPSLLPPQVQILNAILSAGSFTPILKTFCRN